MTTDTATDPTIPAISCDLAADETITTACGLVQQLMDRPADKHAPETVDACMRGLNKLMKLTYAAQLAFITAAQKQGLAERSGARSIKTWLQRTLNISGCDAATRVTLAEAAEPHDNALAQALRTGRISAEHCRVIARCITALPPHLTAAQRTEAERWLLAQADDLTPAELRQAADRLRFTLDPAQAARAEEKKKADRELNITRQPSGMDLIRLSCEPEMTAKLCTVLEPLAAPAPADDGTPDLRSAACRRADALDSALECLLSADTLPTTGGASQQLLVAIPYQSLTEDAATVIGTQPGVLAATGEPISPGAARRIACDATILPVVLGGDSVPLDIGRQRRAAPPQIRAALLQRDGRCAFPGCDPPPGTSHAHHCVHWADHGETSLANMVMLCSAHHRILHAQEWQARVNEYGRPEFIPPSTVDPQRMPRPGRRPPSELPELLLTG